MVKPVLFSYRITDVPQLAFHSHPFYEIYYFHEGKCNYVIGPNVYSLKPGDLIAMHGMTLHRPNPDIRQPYVRTILHFEPQFLHEYMNRTYVQPLLQPFHNFRNIRLRTGEARDEVESLLAEMAKWHASESPFSYERFLLRVVDLLYVVNGLCRRPLSAPQAPATERERHVQSVIDYIEAHYAEPLTMAELEKELHVNRHYLSRVFREWTGTTIFQYLYHRRINQAKTLFLVENGLSVSEVGARVGFKHLPHFSRVFKRAEGCPPEQYRRRVASSARPL